MALRTGEHYSIAQLLPHGPGFLLLDRLVSYDGDSVTCEVTVRPDSLFCDGRSVPGWVGLEYVAQAVGALVGIRRLQLGLQVQVCMLLGTRAYVCALPEFPVGMTLTAHAQELMRGHDGVGGYACELRHGARSVATAEIKGFDPDDIEPFLQQLEGDGARA